MIITKQVSFEMEDTEIVRLFMMERREGGRELPISVLTRELLPAFHFVRAHRIDFFDNIPIEATVSLRHQDGDDPPDVVFEFKDRTVAIEVTSADPKHFHQNEDIREEFRYQGIVTHDLPRSIATKSRQESERKLTGQDPDTWESVSDYLKSSIDGILREVKRKIEKRNVQDLVEKYSIAVVLVTGQFLDDAHWNKILRGFIENFNFNKTRGIRIGIISGRFVPNGVILGKSALLR